MNEAQKKPRSQAAAILSMWESGFVNRWHSNVHHGLRNSQDTTAAHAQRVGILLVLLFDHMRTPTQMYGLLYEAIVHDAPEEFTGDMSYEAKRHVPGMRDKIREAEGAWWAEAEMCGVPAIAPKLSPEVAVCDWLDAYLFARSVDKSLVERDDWKKQRALYLEKAEALRVGSIVEVLTR